MLMRSTNFKPSIGKYTDHGWSEDGEAIWCEDQIQEEIRDILYEDAANKAAADDEADEGDDLLDEEDDTGNKEECDDDNDVELFDYQ